MVSTNFNAGIIIQHNFIEAHTTTGQVPSELAGLKMELGVNRWLGLIKLSSFPNIKLNCASNSKP